MKQSNLSFEGTVLQELGNSMFSVRLDSVPGEPEIICTICGKIRKNYIRILAGDKVMVEMSPYDMTKGRIAVRLKNEAMIQHQQNSSFKNSINNKKKKK